MNRTILCVLFPKAAYASLALGEAALGPLLRTLPDVQFTSY